MSDLRLKCIKIDFAPDPAEGACSDPQTPELDLRGPTTRGRGYRKGGEGEREGRQGVEEGKGRVREGRE